MHRTHLGSNGFEVDETGAPYEAEREVLSASLRT